MSPEIEVYRKHKNLKIAADELGINWKTLYCRLKKLGEPVSGDKIRYGSDRDKLGALAESIFKNVVPNAITLNDKKWQSKVDFSVNGWLVDVKSSVPRKLSKKYETESWSFSFKKQTFLCDFFCCFCLSEDKEIEHVLLVPKEFFEGLQTISVSRLGSSKWLDYEVSKDELAQFFEDLGEKI